MKPVSGLELELALLGKAFLSGILLTVFYDVIRVIRRMIPHGIVWISLEDFVYGIVAGSWLFLKVCQVNDGIIRFYMILGIAAGRAALPAFARTADDALAHKMDPLCTKAVEKRCKSRYNKARENSQESGDGE